MQLFQRHIKMNSDRMQYLYHKDEGASFLLSPKM
jgi:hypothetical protein